MTDLKELVRRVPEEILTKRKIDAVDEVFAEHYMEHFWDTNPMPEEASSTREALKGFFSELLAAFPDFEATAEQATTEGNFVTMRTPYRGTPQGDFMGIPATGRHAAWDEIHICRIADGAIAEHWECVDFFGLFVQLGVVTPPG